MANRLPIIAIVVGRHPVPRSIRRSSSSTRASRRSCSASARSSTSRPSPASISSAVRLHRCRQRADNREPHAALRPRQHPRSGLGRQVLRSRCLRGLPDHRCADVPAGGFGRPCNSAEQRLRTRLDAALRRVYGLRGFESALSEERASMMREVRDQLRPDAASLGLEIEDVRIRRTDLTKEVSQQTFERMKAERLAEAELIRARGREAASASALAPTARWSRSSPKRARNRKSCAARAKPSATRSSPKPSSAIRGSSSSTVR